LKRSECRVVKPHPELLLFTLRHYSLLLALFCAVPFSVGEAIRPAGDGPQRPLWRSTTNPRAVREREAPECRSRPPPTGHHSQFYRALDERGLPWHRRSPWKNDDEASHLGDVAPEPPSLLPKRGIVVWLCSS